MSRLFLTPASRGRAAVLWTLLLFALSQLALGLWICRRHPELRDPEFSSVLTGLRSRLAEAPGRPLVLVLGSSRPANSLRPAILTRALADTEPSPVVFNAALLWGGPLHELLVFRRLLADGVRPDWLLIEVFPPMLTQQGAFSEETFITARGLEWTDGPLVYRYFRELDDGSIIRSMLPATKSCTAGPSPRYEMNWNFVPVAFWNARPARFPVEPTPGIPALALSGFSFSQAMNSNRFFAGSEFLMQIKSGSLPISAIGDKSVSRLYGS